MLNNLSLFLEDQWAARVTFPDMVEEVPLLVEAVVTVDALERLHIRMNYSVCAQRAPPSK